MAQEVMRLKVLISAYSCEPGYSSERGVGWNWAIQMAKYHDAWVITRQTNRSAIESALSEEDVPGLKFVYHDLPKWMRAWKKGERGLYLYYFLWQLTSLIVARRLNRQVGFDLTHYVTFGSVLLPTFIYLLQTRFIFGPIGGGGKAPLNFLNEFSLHGKVNELLRHLVHQVYRINPFLYFAFRKADKILVRDKETLRMVPDRLKAKCLVFPETGLPQEFLRDKKRQKSKNNLVIAIVGRFLHSKISVLTLKILSRFKDKYQKPFKVYIVGDGRERRQLMKFLSRDNINENVEFTGWLSREGVFEILLKSDIYVSTSFKEGGSWALFEAIAMELPVVCFRAGGPDILVCDDCGIKVAIENPQQVIEDFSNALLKLADSSELRRSMARKAKAHLLESYTWEEMGRRMNRIYEEVVS